MGRPVYPYELSDPDFSWLITTFRENHPSYQVVEEGCLPIVLIASTNEGRSDSQEEEASFEPAEYEELMAGEHADEGSEEKMS